MLQKNLKAGNMMKFIGYLKKEYPGLKWERTEHPATKATIYTINLVDLKTQIKIEMVNTGALVSIPNEFFQFDMKLYKKLEQYIEAFFK